MNAITERNGMSVLNGNFLRLGTGREIAIYFRDGMAWVAEFGKGHAQIHHASAWLSVYGRAFVHAQRRGEVEIVSPTPVDIVARIDGLHVAMDKKNDAPVIQRAPAKVTDALARWPHYAA